jgi:hypothetical protein
VDLILKFVRESQTCEFAAGVVNNFFPLHLAITVICFFYFLLTQSFLSFSKIIKDALIGLQNSLISFYWELKIRCNHFN